MANLRSLVSLIVYASMVMVQVQPITAKRLLTPAADESSKQTFDADKLKSLLCHFLELKFMYHSDSSSYKGDWLEHICPSPEPECPSQYVTSLSNLGLDIPDAIPDIPDPGQAFVSIPVTLKAGCNCIVDNVAIAIGIDHRRVGDLAMYLLSPDDDRELFSFSHLILPTW